MSAVYRAVRALLALGCSPRQVLECSLPAELVDGCDSVRLLAGLVAPHRGSLALQRYVEQAHDELRAPRIRATSRQTATGDRTRGLER